MNYRLVILFIVVFVSCKKGHRTDCFMSTGGKATETRQLQPFSRVILNDRINLIIVPDTIYSAVLEGGENILPGIRTETFNGVLEIDNDNRCNWTRSLREDVNVTVHVPGLTHIRYFGSGNISCSDTIKAFEFFLDSEGSGSIDLKLDAKIGTFAIHSGPADFTVKGYCGVEYVYSTGNGWMYLDSLESGYCFINNSGTGDISIFVKKLLDSKQHSSGNILYRGNPAEIKSVTTGSGKITPIQ